MATPWRRLARWWWAWLAGLAVAVASLLAMFLDRGHPDGTGWMAAGGRQLPLTTDRAVHDAVDPASCVDCHAEAVEAWQHSHHALANRPLLASNAADVAPFLQAGASWAEDGEIFHLRRQGDTFTLAVERPGAETREFPIVGLIGVDPLVNFLVAMPDGRVQATSLGWDVHRKELFDTFDGQERLVGDYGHWLGQGLNWNANCAWCHMTGFSKELVEETLGYRSRWVAQGIGCAQCHPGSAEHAELQRAGRKDHAPATLAKEQIFDNCLSCHSRRGELTDGKFVAGDSYHDHFSLSLPDQAGLYFPDGQILDEVFAGASLKLSAMGHAGVRCLDCHEPHGAGLVLPWENNALCLQCHGPGVRGAKPIDPLGHAFHDPAKAGGRCVDCHMPQRTYMARHPRHDHAFPVPDPFLSRELGVPNACSQCHEDKDLEWAEKQVIAWYGEGFHERREPTRSRARLAVEAHAGKARPEALAAAIASEQNGAWRATWVGLLATLPPSPVAAAVLDKVTDDPDPLVRERAATLQRRALPTADPKPFLVDPLRAVRIASLQARPRGEPVPAALTAEWDAFLRAGGDRPQVMLARARESLDRGDIDTMGRLLGQVTTMLPNEAEARRQAALLHHEAGQSEEAEALFREALRLSPRDASLHVDLALLLAERRRLDEAIASFRAGLSIDPDFPRARYNLIVALGTVGAWEEASHQLDLALARQPRDPALLSLRPWIASSMPNRGSR